MFSACKFGWVDLELPLELIVAIMNVGWNFAIFNDIVLGGNKTALDKKRR